MWTSSILMLLTSIANSNFAFGATLIVTHPQIAWDKSRASGMASRLLLIDPRFDHKIVLWSGGVQKKIEAGTPTELTFDSSELDVEFRHSFEGEWTPNAGETHFTLAGGFWTSCMRNTVIDLLTVVAPDTVLRFKLDAIYTGSQRSNGTISLRQALKENPEIWEQRVQPEVALFLDVLNSRSRLSSSAETYSVEVFRDGVRVESLGTGAKKVTLLFD